MQLRLQHVGPISEAELAFGDLTVLVGPQASGEAAQPGGGSSGRKIPLKPHTPA